MRVHIYTVDHEKEIKGELVGTVSYTGGKLVIDALDQRIKDIINKKVINGSGKKRRMLDFFYISTPEFIQKLGIECWKRGYVAEIAG